MKETKNVVDIKSYVKKYAENVASIKNVINIEYVVKV